MSTNLACHIYKAVDDNWYLELANDKHKSTFTEDELSHCYDPQMDAYGPYVTMAECYHVLDQYFANPGNSSEWDGGMPVPANPTYLAPSYKNEQEATSIRTPPPKKEGIEISDLLLVRAASGKVWLDMSVEVDGALFGARGLLNKDKSFGGFNETYIGFDRLIDAVNKTGPNGAETFVAKVAEAVQVFVAERARQDARAKPNLARNSGR